MSSTIDWLRLGMILTTGSAATALVWVGMTIAGLGEERLGFGIAAIGVVVFLAVSQAGCGTEEDIDARL